MAQVVREVRERTVSDDDAQQTVRARDDDGMVVLARIIYFIGGAIMSVIGLRILLSLLGANRNNEFAALIYNLSYPFVAPFFGLFNYRMQYGVSRFEFESLVALIVWGLLAAGVARLVLIGNRNDTVN